MGKVYEAKHVQLGKKIALKFLHKEFAEDKEFFERFHREARIAGNLGHTNIAEVFDYGISADGLPFIVMEYLEGKSLAQTINEKGILETNEAIIIINQVLEALKETHNNKIVHRDLKPENIFLAQVKGRGEEVKILDFGISKIMMKESVSVRLTKTGTSLGTPYYMSPEQIKATFIDHRTDLYACGVILFEMVTGQVPYVGNTHNEIIINVITSPVPDPKNLNPDLTVNFCKLLVRAIDKDPEKRFQDATIFLQSLSEISGKKPAERKTLAKERRKQIIESTETITRTEANFFSRSLGSSRKHKIFLIASFIALVILVVSLVFIIINSKKYHIKTYDKAPFATNNEKRNMIFAVEKPEVFRVLVINHPEGAMVKYGNREKPAGELLLPASKKPVTLTITAKGYQERRFVFVPDEDRIIDGSLVKIMEFISSGTVIGTEPAEHPTRKKDKASIKKSGTAITFDTSEDSGKKKKKEKREKKTPKTEEKDERFKWEYK